MPPAPSPPVGKAKGQVLPSCLSLSSSPTPHPAFCMPFKFGVSPQPGFFSFSQVAGSEEVCKEQEKNEFFPYH